MRDLDETAARLSFRLSRVYAEGWNAARRAPSKAGGKTGLNPYPSEPERTRWNEGFAKAAE